jgi:hypothetical protein
MEEELNNWLEENIELYVLVSGIRERFSSDEQAALAAFNEVSELLHLPKRMEDITDEMHEEHFKLDKQASSVFHELAIINYIFPEQTIFDKVILALYLVAHKEQCSIYNAAELHFGSKFTIPERFSYLVFGKDIDARISFDFPESGCWTDTGAVSLVTVLS